jgi:hypothetical protein
MEAPFPWRVTNENLDEQRKMNCEHLTVINSKGLFSSSVSGIKPLSFGTDSSRNKRVHRAKSL